MNIDPSGSRNTDQTSTMIDDLASSVGYVKSYRCTFCKRGFSSAQALGGHMNIHRRDRAKLREFSDDKLLTLDIGKSKDSQNNSSSGEKLMIRSKAGHDHDHGKADHSPNLVWRLPIIAEAATPPEIGGDQEREAGGGGGGGFGKHLEESGGGVDLELRLGIEPS